MKPNNIILYITNKIQHLKNFAQNLHPHCTCTINKNTRSLLLCNLPHFLSDLNTFTKFLNNNGYIYTIQSDYIYIDIDYNTQEFQIFTTTITIATLDFNNMTYQHLFQSIFSIAQNNIAVDIAFCNALYKLFYLKNTKYAQFVLNDIVKKKKSKEKLSTFSLSFFNNLFLI